MKMDDNEIKAALAEVHADWLMDENDEYCQAAAIRHVVAAAEAAERKRQAARHVLAYMATSRDGTTLLTDKPDAARDLESFGWVITPLSDAGH